MATSWGLRLLTRVMKERILQVQSVVGTGTAAVGLQLDVNIITLSATEKETI